MLILNFVFSLFFQDTCTLTSYTSLGFVSNGEYNSFRSKGYTRPLSVFQIRSLVRNKYARMNVKSMKAMLNPIGTYVKMNKC